MGMDKNKHWKDFITRYILNDLGLEGTRWDWNSTKSGCVFKLHAAKLIDFIEKGKVGIEMVLTILLSCYLGNIMEIAYISLKLLCKKFMGFCRESVPISIYSLVLLDAIQNHNLNMD